MPRRRSRTTLFGVQLPAALHRLLLTQTLSETRRAICEGAALLSAADAVHLLEPDAAGDLSSTAAHRAEATTDELLRALGAEATRARQPRGAVDRRGRLYLAYPLEHRGRPEGVLVLVCFDRQQLDPEQHSAIRRYHEAAAAALSGARARSDLGRLATTDPLTGVLNRRGLERALDGVDGDRGLLMIDFDDLKTLNDELDYSVGDAVLVAIGAALNAEAAPGEAVARLGGDEFMLVVPETGAAALEARAGSLSDRLDRLPVPPAAQALYRGASVGFAVAGPGESPELVIRRATQHMRTRKRRRTSDGARA